MVVMGKRVSRIQGLMFGIAALAGLFALAGADPSGAANARKAEIVFSSNGKLVSIDADGSSRKVLPFDGPAYAPEISPDGRKLLFTGGVGRKTALVVASRGGRNAEPVFPSRSRKAIADGHVTTHAAGATWSVADGRIYLIAQSFVNRHKRLNLAGQRDYRYDKVISIKADGSGKRTLMTRTYGPFDSSNSLSRLDVSPDGRKILLGAYQFRGSSSPLELFDRSTGKVKVLRRSAEGGQWSPDGRRILFESDHEKTGQECNDDQVCYYDHKLFVMRPDGSGLKRITMKRKPGDENSSEWSPDGTRIVFSSDRNAPDGFYSRELYSIRPDGKCLTWLTNGSPGSFDPTWGPETNRDFAPVACGDGDRPPLAQSKPGKWRRPDGKPVGLARLWLGPAFGPLLFSYSYDGEVAYEDCSRFLPAECGVPVRLPAERVCSDNGETSPTDLVEGGGLANVTKRHGALIMTAKYEYNYQQNVLVVTGGQVVRLEGATYAYSISDSLANELVDGLRPVGSPDASAALAPAVFDSRLIDRSGRIHDAFTTSQSVASTAEKFGREPDVVRSYLAFYDALQGVGPYKTVACSSGKG